MNEPTVEKINDLRKGLEFVLKWEGGYSNDASDPGGKTKWGITSKSYPEEDIENLTRERALEIYANDYWLAAGCDEIPFPYNVAVFDTAVNCGVANARKWYEQSDNAAKFMDMRRDYYVSIINKNTNLIKYARGWWNRMIDMNKYLAINGGFDDVLGRS